MQKRLSVLFVSETKVPLDLSDSQEVIIDKSHLSKSAKEEDDIQNIGTMEDAVVYGNKEASGLMKWMMRIEEKLERRQGTHEVGLSIRERYFEAYRITDIDGQKRQERSKAYLIGNQCAHEAFLRADVNLYTRSDAPDNNLFAEIYGVEATTALAVMDVGDNTDVQICMEARADHQYKYRSTNDKIDAWYNQVLAHGLVDTDYAFCDITSTREEAIRKFREELKDEACIKDVENRTRKFASNPSQAPRYRNHRKPGEAQRF